MMDFENVLQECLRDLEQGASSVEECLRRYPSHARELQPILLTSAYLARGHEARLSPAFKARVRTRLIQQMYARPRKQAPANFTFMRLAVSLAVTLLALLVTGTVYAQRAVPGEMFYAWKLASENAWRVVSPDPVGIDLAIAERRLNELAAVKDDPALQAQTLDAYLQVAERLRSQLNAANEARILATLNSQAEELNRLGILPEQPDQNVVPTLQAPTATPETTPLPVLETLQVNPTDLPEVVPTVRVSPPTNLPEVVPTVRVLPPTDLPQVVPTVQVPPEIVTVIPELPEIIPTIKIPPLIP